MQIWTTPYLNSLLSITELPVRLVSDNEIKKTFLDRAGPHDMAIVAIDDRCQVFLDAVKERGLCGPVLFISPEPLMIEPVFQRHNAAVLDIKKLGPAAAADIVRFLLTTARFYYLSGTTAPEFGASRAAESEDERLIEGRASIHERLTYVVEKQAPVIVAVEVGEHGEPVTARGTCAVKNLESDALLLHGFKQPPLLRSLRQGCSIRLYFTYKQNNHGAVVTVTRAAGQEIHTTFPAKLFPTREMRIQPNRNKPVVLYMHIPDEPTTSLRVLDISPHGIGFLCNRDLRVNAYYGLTLLFPDPQAVVLTVGQLRFKKEEARGFRYGAGIRPHPWDQEIIAKYVMNREAELISLLRSDAV